ncbi:ABC transporter ATP-binding protein [Martelella radicis]|uniref:Oligopeptide/dipeptide ABC transporter ATP-binding protein n=1 Tax=Martelella radicis TaxID=1397476 RepID=A0A7W6KNM1_9HYPH|nr:oligopeptide/dipeptide ABC transporter ATP-binding protein [Martelella radicis]MBB4124562.1 oligopeptide/dipeptide ABC transporter ATP-binding protein [Martelella radicis]
MTPSLSSPENILELRGVKKFFPVRRGLLQRHVAVVRAVDGVDLDIRRGETLSLVGESGSGKSTLGRLVASLDTASAGEILFADGNGAAVDIARLPASGVKALRRKIQLIFQDPYASLNPRMTTEQIIAEPLRVNGIASGKALAELVRMQIEQVGLRADQLDNYPHEFSGGQRQRIGIARALAINPQLVIADEPVSALDTSVQAQVLNLLTDLSREKALTLLFISHDLSVVRHISDRIAVMYLGRIVEVSETSRLFAAPKHPYSEALISVTPSPDPRLRRKRIVLEGEIPNPISPPSGCAFHPRCRYATDLCKAERPPLAGVGEGRKVACHHAEALDLQGLKGDVA